MVSNQPQRMVIGTKPHPKTWVTAYRFSFPPIQTAKTSVEGRGIQTHERMNLKMDC